MKNIILICSILIVIILLGCTKLATLEYYIKIPPDIREPEPVNFNLWEIDPPKVIAYKKAKADDVLFKPKTFWTTIVARSPYKDSVLAQNLLIDTVWFEYSNSGERLFRIPSRVAEFTDTRKKYHQIVFNFFQGSGIDIPAEVPSIILSFTAKQIDENNNVVSSEEFKFEMFRRDSTTKLPVISPR